MTRTRTAALALAIIVIFGAWWAFGSPGLLLGIVVLLPIMGRLNILQGRLPIGGGFGCSHNFEHLPGLTVPQCSKCGSYQE